MPIFNLPAAAQNRTVDLAAGENQPGVAGDIVSVVLNGGDGMMIAGIACTAARSQVTGSHLSLFCYEVSIWQASVITGVWIIT